MRSETIFALSTAAGKAGIAIIRISGEKAFEAVKKLAGSVPSARNAVFRKLVYNDELVDQAIVVCFPAKNSYTGEDLAEFHIHGSNAIIQELSDILSCGLNLSFAKPGEFTQRALENGKMDLSQVEAVIGLIEAETKEQKKQSLNVLSGGINNKATEWRGLLVQALGLVEVMIDFSDQDIEANFKGEINVLIIKLISYLEKELTQYKSSEIIRDGYDITIIGKPNVGKSSLLNYIAGKEKAIVSSYAGTTRDIIELGIDLQGYRVNFFDTAGIHKTDNIVEGIGIEKAIKKAKDSNMRIFLLENNDIADQFFIKVQPNDLILSAKVDIHKPEELLGISAKTGEGIDNMLDLIFKRIKNETVSSSVLINIRHKSLIKNAVKSLYSSKDELDETNFQIEIVAEYLRSAIVQLDLLVGKINVEDILGAIFSKFCIGK